MAVFLFELMLIAGLLWLRRTHISPGICAVLYTIGWMTPWIIPYAVHNEASWWALRWPIAAFVLAWGYFALCRSLWDSRWRWPIVGAGAVVLAAVV